jgi:hypothetical protein
MNERIKELIGQTLDEKFAGTWSVMDLQDLTKFADRFAELIIADMFVIIADPKSYNRCVFTTFDAGNGACVAEELTKQIKQKFKD